MTHPPDRLHKTRSRADRSQNAYADSGMENQRRATILTGLGALYGRDHLESGADGFMTGFAFPEVLQAFVAERKEIFRQRGLITSSHVRHPGRSIDADTTRHLTRTLASILPGMDIKKPLAL